jgi:hypothetical protein
MCSHSELFRLLFVIFRTCAEWNITVNSCLPPRSMFPRTVDFYGICYWGSILKCIGRFNFHLYLFNITITLSEVQFDRTFSKTKNSFFLICVHDIACLILHGRQEKRLVRPWCMIFSVCGDVFVTVVREHELRNMQSTHFDITCSLAEVRHSFCFSVGVH